MYDLLGAEPAQVPLTLYTDSFVIKGQIRTRQTRVTDILNHADEDFLVLSDTVVDEYGTRALASRSEYAQVNLDAVLFAVADTPVEARPDLRTPKVAEQAMISIPPFRVIGRIHVLGERDLREALNELTGRFLPVTDAIYWSDIAGEARQNAAMVAINHRRAQILAPHREVDPWAGLDRGGEGSSAAAGGSGASGGPSAAGGFGGSGAAPDFGAAGSPGDRPAWPAADQPR